MSATIRHGSSDADETWTEPRLNLRERGLKVPRSLCLGLGVWLVVHSTVVGSPAVPASAAQESATSEPPAPVIPGLQGRHPLSEAQVGQVLLSELRCAACHEGPANELPEKTAPVLDEVGARVSPDFLRRFLANPAATRPGTTMPDVLAGQSREQRTAIAGALAAFLESHASSSFERRVVEAADIQRGRDLFHSIGCLACHPSPENTTSPDGVPLTHSADKYGADSLAAFLFQPHQVRPGGRMPDMNLSRDEARFIAGYLVGSEAERASPSDRDDPAAPDPQLVESGRRFFEQFRCSSCHPLDRTTAPPRVPIHSVDEGCLSSKRAPGAAPSAPDYNLGSEQMRALRRALSSDATRASDADRLALALTAFNCIGCHERDGYGGVPEDRDPFFTTSQNDLGNEARIPPQLTRSGAKLRSAWMHRVLFDGATVRPYMHARMPQFGDVNLAALPGLFARLDAQDPLVIKEPQGKRRGELRDIGRTLLGDRGLNCITCHDFNSKPSPGFRGLDLIGSFERLQPRWFFDYMMAPQAHRPGTVMPTYWSEFEPTFPEILEGDPHAQIEAIWWVLSLGRSAPDPPGIRSTGFRLAVEDEPRTYRGRSRIAGFRGIAVGFPGGVNYAFNAENGALSGLWHGDFVNVSWRGQGAGDFHPAARAVQLAQDLGIAALDSDRTPWPARPVLDQKEPLNPDPVYPRHLGYQFRGYELDAERVPTIRYRFADVNVEERSVPGTGERPSLQRTVTWSAEAPTSVYLRVLTGEVKAIGPGRFGTGDVQVRLEDSDRVRIVLRPLNTIAIGSEDNPESEDPAKKPPKSAGGGNPTGSSDDEPPPEQFELLIVLDVQPEPADVRIDYELLR